MQEETTQNKRPQKGKKTVRRNILFILGPLLVGIIGGYLYITGGRYAETDNAYVQSDKVIISAQVTGLVKSVHVQENQLVKQGDILLNLEDRDYQIELDKARAHLQQERSNIAMIKANYNQLADQLQIAQLDQDFAQSEYKRRVALSQKRVASQAQLDQAKHDLNVSKRKIEVIKQQMTRVLANLEGDPNIPAEKVAAYQLALAEVDNAKLAFERTRIRAPFGGTVSKVPKIGQYVKPGTAIMSLIADHGFWIEANFKETDLTHVSLDQPVTISIDTYPDLKISGRVESISPGTGSEFSVLPAQNASGNWVKIVQRVPVKIKLSAQAYEVMLRAGMSSTVSIDTGYHRKVPHFVSNSLYSLGMTKSANAAQVK